MKAAWALLMYARPTLSLDSGRIANADYSGYKAKTSCLDYSRS